MTAIAKKQRIWFSTIFMVLVTAAVYIADQTGNLTAWRMTAHGVLKPGRAMLLSLTGPQTANVAHSSVSSDDVASLQQALLENELQRRQLMIENARLQHEVKTNRRLSEIETMAGYDLVDFVGLKAVVLSHDGMSGPMGDLFVDAGKSQGLRTSQLIIDGDGVLLDKGTDHRLHADQKIVVGSAVVGRIARVAQWVSLVQPITHEEFSAAVQIATLAPQGASYVAQGLLEGTGEGMCRVTGIAYTDSVSVGDDVFSADINGIHGPRLYYGRVTRAEFSSGGNWEVDVEPAVDLRKLNEVTVIHPRLNAVRTKELQ